MLSFQEKTQSERGVTKLMTLFCNQLSELNMSCCQICVLDDAEDSRDQDLPPASDDGAFLKILKSSTSTVSG